MANKKVSGIINKIEEIRKTNNFQWMNLMRLAFKHAPKESQKIMAQIGKRDSEINALTKQLGEAVK